MFLLVLAHPGSPGQRAIKRLCVCVCVSHVLLVCLQRVSSAAQRVDTERVRSVVHTQPESKALYDTQGEFTMWRRIRLNY